MTFGGETFPLMVPAGVSLMTADANGNPSDYVIAYAGGVGSVLTLGDGSALRGFSISASGGAASMVSCTKGAVTLDTVALDGGGAVGNGLEVGTTCSATLQSFSASTSRARPLGVAHVGHREHRGRPAQRLADWPLADQRNHDRQRPGRAEQRAVRDPADSGTAGTPSLALTGQSQVENNGTTGSFAGISVGKGTLSVSNSQMTGNGGAGIELASSGPYTLTGVQVSNNTQVGGVADQRRSDRQRPGGDQQHMPTV